MTHCEWCGEPPLKNERTITLRWLDDSGIHATCFHEECHAAGEKWAEEHPEDLMPQPRTMKRGSTEEKPPNSTWLPIETAPQDGTLVLYFSPPSDPWVGNQPPNHVRGKWSYDEELNLWCGGALPTLKQDPTHWMPIPPNPPST